MIKYQTGPDCHRNCSVILLFGPFTNTNWPAFYKSFRVPTDFAKILLMTSPIPNLLAQILHFRHFAEHARKCRLTNLMLNFFMLEEKGNIGKFWWLITKLHDFLPFFHDSWLFHDHFHFPVFSGISVSVDTGSPWPLFPLFFQYSYLYFPYFSAFFLEFCYLYLNQWQSRSECLSHLRGNNRRPIKCHWIFSAARACFPMVIILCLWVPPCLAAMLVLDPLYLFIHPNPR